MPELSEPQRKKLTLPSEIVYVLYQVIISFAVAMVSAADFGVSMIVAPAYILHLKLTFLTFGQCEYILQAIVFCVLLILLRKVRISYFFSFATCVLYGLLLDFWRLVIPLFNPSVTAPGSMSMPVRILLFAGGMILTSFSVALCFRTYIPSQVYDFCVVRITEHFSLGRTKFKWLFDAGCLLTATAMTLIFFGTFRGIGIGTLVITALNGLLIGLFGKLLDHLFTFPPLFPKCEAFFRR